MPPTYRQQRGAEGEDAVARWYARHGYQVLDRNWRCREGELDLVVAKAGTVVFCEVKTRTTEQFGHPAEAVTPAKQRKVRTAAYRWMATNEARPLALRFDVATVLRGEVDVIEHAF